MRSADERLDLFCSVLVLSRTHTPGLVLLARLLATYITLPFLLVSPVGKADVVLADMIPFANSFYLVGFKAAIERASFLL